MALLLFISGLALFLHAIHKMESALGNLGNRSLKHAIRHFTRTPLHGIAVGIISTAILQSSSVVGLITLAFVGAGVIRLFNAIGIILGSNLGTTFTGWIVTLIGFKLNLTEFYVPILGMSALGLILTGGRSRWHQWYHFFFALGLLLMGLLLMKDSIHFVSDYVDVEALAKYPPWVFFIAGALITAVTQSSSATMMMTLTAMHAGIIQLPEAAALIIGADLGTTSTVIIGSLQGAAIKRQVSLIHFVFNLVTDLLAYSALPLLLWLITDVYAIEDPLYGLVALHSTFNLIGIILFLPFIRQLQLLTEKLVGTEAKPHLAIENVNQEVTDVALATATEDIRQMIQRSVLLNCRRMQFLSLVESEKPAAMQLPDTIDDHYRSLKQDENTLSDYLLDLQRATSEREQIAQAQQLLVCIRDGIYAAKSTKDIQADVEELFADENAPAWPALDALFHATRDFYRESMDCLSGKRVLDTEHSARLLQNIKAAHQEFNTRVYALIDSRALRHEEASTALNINRELLLSAHSLINALDHFFIKKETAQTLSEILNIER